MDKSMELIKMDRLVKAILTKHPETRNSDLTLYLKICQYMNSKALNEPFGYVLAHPSEFGLPNYDSVGRCRRKQQEEHTELQADEKVASRRKKNIAIFKDYAWGLLNEG